MDVCLYKLKNGMGLHRFCKQKGYSYQAIHTRIQLFDESVDEAIAEYLRRRGRKDCHAKLFVKGMRLKDYCKEHGLSLTTVLSRYYRCRISLEDAVNFKNCYKKRSK